MSKRNEDSRSAPPPLPVPAPPKDGPVERAVPPPVPGAAPASLDSPAPPPPKPTSAVEVIDAPPASPPPDVGDLPKTGTGHRWKNAPAPPEPRTDEKTGDEDADEQLAWWRRKWDEAMEASPPWLVSFVFHLVLLLILALLTIPNPAIQSVMLVLDPSLATDEGLDDDEFQVEATDLDVETPEVSFDELSVEDPLAAMPEIELDLSGLTAAANINATSIGAALTGREEGNKKALLAQYGGTKTTEEAVKLALGWLARQQRADGSWSLTGPYSNGALTENRVAATAMALLAFQGAGITPTKGKYKAEVAKGSKVLLKMQGRDGFFRERNGSRHQQLYAHAQAMIAICELYGMTKDSKYKQPAQKAIRFAVKTQATEGGWRYQLGVDSDLSVTGWFLMGLQSARMAGLEVPRDTLYRITEFLDKVQTRNGSRYRYRVGEGGPTPSMTAEGLLCRQYLGWDQDDSRLVRGVRSLVERPINYRQMDVYYWYYATQVCHHQEGEAWEKWNAVMRERVPAAQIKVGREKGSWDPRTDAWGNLGGRLYTTCLSTYMLEVYYRHLPIYSYRKKKK